MDHRIVNAKNYHAGSIYELYQESLEHHSNTGWTEKKISETLRDENVEIFVAVSDTEQVLGFAMTRYQQYTSLLELLAVSARSQRKGIGNALLTHIAANAAKQYCACIEVKVYAGNSKAIAFYRVNNFQQKSILPRYYCGNRNALLLVKTL